MLPSSILRGSFFILLLITSLFQPALSQNISYPLKSQWQFRKQGDGQWMPATVPGTVHTDLMANKKIPDPYYRDNESKVQWVSKENWEYQSSFNLDAKTFGKKHIELSFLGLDTYADVYLNDEKILAADNMFRTWVVDIKPWARLKNNKLLIRFYSAEKMVDSLARLALPLVRPSENNRHYARKAQYHFGWDWGPRIITCGIWRGVKIEGWDDEKIESVELDRSNNKFLTIKVINKSGQNHRVAISDNSDTTGLKFIPPFEELCDQIDDVEKGLEQFVCPCDSVTKWGQKKNADYTIHLLDIDGDKHFDTKKFITTSTNIQLIQQPDSLGQSFYFTVNGKPTFIKGANWIPADMFLPRITKAKYRQLLVAAKKANINMLRVWGGGIYEDDAFYDLCDSLGIMVWQDFMFAGAMYPGDARFIENVKQEAIDNIKRLSRHPCIAVWCGNNEIDEAWHNWGWQNQFHLSPADSAWLWTDYKKLFHELLPQLVKELDGRPYITTSPLNGWGRKESMTHGDSHYWGVWWGLEPIGKYKEKVPRFMSEYGMQAMPDMETIKQFALPLDYDTASAVMKAHQKHPTGYRTLATYLNQNNLHPTTFTGFVTATQELQSRAMDTAITANMFSNGRCMGTMFWQFNDCWPVCSWSVVDYYGRKKKAYHTVKRLYGMKAK